MARKTTIDGESQLDLCDALAKCDRQREIFERETGLSNDPPDLHSNDHNGPGVDMYRKK